VLTATVQGECTADLPYLQDFKTKYYCIQSRKQEIDCNFGRQLMLNELRRDGYTTIGERRL